MKYPVLVLCGIFFLNSCVFEQPFEPEARLTADPALAGLWQEDLADAKRAPNRLLVLAHSDHEWLVQYPVGEADKTMFFRAYPIDLAGGRYVQIQLIGTGKCPVKPADRKYHLFKINAMDGAMEVMTLNPKTLGEVPPDTQSMREAFERVKDQADLFGDAIRFKRL